MSSITLLSGSLYPDKSFSIGLVPRKKKRAEDSVYDRLWFNQEGVNYAALADWLEGKTNVLGKYVSLSENPARRIEVLKHDVGTEGVIAILEAVERCSGRDFSRFYDCTEDMERPLLVKSPKSSQKKRGSYGKHGITRFGRKVCKNACILLQQRYGIKRLGFGTCTLPKMDKSVCETIIANWGDISRRFYQRLRRICKGRGFEFIYVGCTEIQEKRFKNSGVPVPHLHFVYVSKISASSGYLVSTQEAYSAWNDSVNEVLVLRGKEPIMGTGDHIGSVKLEFIRKSAAAYLGKYISKGVKVVEEMKERGYEEFPKQWWSASQITKDMFKASVVRLPQDMCSEFFYNFDAWMQTELVSWGQRIYISIDGHEYCVGVVGTLSDEIYKQIVSISQQVVLSECTPAFTKWLSIVGFVG